MLSVTCCCGKRISVTAGQAGATVACACGMTTDVPSLSVLRRDAEAAGIQTTPPLRPHDWRVWWWGVKVLILGELMTILGVILAFNPTNLVAAVGAIAAIAGFGLSLGGAIAIGTGKGYSLGVCFLLLFFPIGRFIILFFPGKGLDATEN